MSEHRTSPPRVAVIEGRRTLIVERRPPLPSRLDVLLAGLRVYPVRVQGWRAACSDQDHRLVLFADGRTRCTDGQVRDLRLYMCRDCEAVQVRDVSVDTIAAYDPMGRGLVRPARVAPRRRDNVIGWYSGARRNQRQYT